MNWMEWTVMITKLLLVIGGARVWYKASRHYLRGQYQQAIYHLLVVILVAVCIK